ncbi:nitroreductase family protein [Paraburkholderia phenoliruptrix]|uniref:nitroreductase family protein n=1 Tax=Paraburkholderia phenoliruptrix TaxID=252970 RepID=UPI0034CEF47F
MDRKPATTEVPINELIAERWSPRAYSDVPVSRADVQSVLEAARWAPSAYNMQPWRFVVFERAVDDVAFSRAFATLVPFNQRWNASAQALIAVTAHTLTPDGEANPTALYDAGAAAFSLVLQAHALGLAAHQMSGFDTDRFRTEFAIPDDVEVITMISLAHYGDHAALGDDLRELESAERTRLPLGEIAYHGAWRQTT